MKLKINGLMNDKDILWKKIPCKCHKSKVELMYPLIECKNCKFQKCEDSMPRENFKSQGKTITEINIVRGSYHDIIGWSF